MRRAKVADVRARLRAFFFRGFEELGHVCGGQRIDGMVFACFRRFRRSPRALLHKHFARITPPSPPFFCLFSILCFPPFGLLRSCPAGPACHFDVTLPWSVVAEFDFERAGGSIVSILVASCRILPTCLRLVLRAVFFWTGRAMGRRRGSLFSFLVASVLTPSPSLSLCPHFTFVFHLCSLRSRSLSIPPAAKSGNLGGSGGEQDGRFNRGSLCYCIPSGRKVGNRESSQ